MNDSVLKQCGKLVLGSLFLSAALTASAAYTPVEWIKASGEQWINTKYTPAGTDKIEMKVNFAKTDTTQALWCSRGTTTVKDTFTSFLVSGKVRVDRNNAGEHVTFLDWNSQLLECLGKLWVYLFRAVTVLLWSRVVDDVLVVNLWEIEVGPLRLLHLFPLAESIQTEFEHPVRFFLDLRDRTDYIFVKALGHVGLLDLCDKAFLVFLLDQVFEFFLCCHYLTS